MTIPVPNNQVVIPEQVLNDDDTLNLTRGIRQQILAVELEHGVPAESRDRRRLMDLLSQIDESSLLAKKLRSDDDNADADRKATLQVERIRSSLGNENVYLRPCKDITPPVIDLSALPDVEVMEGEMDTNVSTATYDEFIQKHG